MLGAYADGHHGHPAPSPTRTSSEEAALASVGPGRRRARPVRLRAAAGPDRPGAGGAPRRGAPLWSSIGGPGHPGRPGGRPGPPFLRAGDCLVVNDTRVLARPAARQHRGDRAGRRGPAAPSGGSRRRKTGRRSSGRPPPVSGRDRVITAGRWRGPGDRHRPGGDGAGRAVRLERGRGGAGLPRGSWAAPAAAVHPPISEPGRRGLGALSDRLRDPAGRRRRAHRGPSLHRGPPRADLGARGSRSIGSRFTLARAPSGRCAPSGSAEHRVEAERYEVPPATAAAVDRARAAGQPRRRGRDDDTSARSRPPPARMAAWCREPAGRISPSCPVTSSASVDALLTNFHLPRSSLPPPRGGLRRAGAGARRAYAHAVRRQLPLLQLRRRDARGVGR